MWGRSLTAQPIAEDIRWVSTVPGADGATEGKVVSGRMRRAGYWGWMAVLTVAYFVLPSQHMVIWSAIGLTSSAAVAVGLRRNRPRRAAPWVLTSLGVFTFVAGDTTYNVLTGVLGEQNPFPSVADVLYLATFPLLATALLSLARSGARSRDRASVLDALILTSGVGLLSWI